MEEKISCLVELIEINWLIINGISMINLVSGHGWHINQYLSHSFPCSPYFLYEFEVWWEYVCIVVWGFSLHDTHKTFESHPTITVFPWQLIQFCLRFPKKAAYQFHSFGHNKTSKDVKTNWLHVLNITKLLWVHLCNATQVNNIYSMFIWNQLNLEGGPNLVRFSIF